RRADAEATAVDQHQGAVRAEAAQVRGGHAAGGGETAGVVTEVLSQAVIEVLRQLVDDVADVHATALHDFLCSDDLDGARAFEVRRRNTRTGDDDSRRFGGGSFLRESRHSGSGREGESKHEAAGADCLSWQCTTHRERYFAEAIHRVPPANDLHRS